MIKKAVFVCSLLAILFSCNSDDTPEPEPVNYEYTQEEKDAEIAWIESYIRENKIEGMIKTESGLFYRIDQKGDGLTPRIDDSVIFHFETTNPKTEEVLSISNREDNPYGQPGDMRSFLKGVQEGFLLINEGSIITMIVPSYLAYGKFGYFYDIPPETILMFKMELNIVLRL